MEKEGIDKYLSPKRSSVKPIVKNLLLKWKVEGKFVIVFD